LFALAAKHKSRFLLVSSMPTLGLVQGKRLDLSQFWLKVFVKNPTQVIE